MSAEGILAAAEAGWAGAEGAGGGVDGEHEQAVVLLQVAEHLHASRVHIEAVIAGSFFSRVSLLKYVLSATRIVISPVPSSVPAISHLRWIRLALLRVTACSRPSDSLAEPYRPACRDSSCGDVLNGLDKFRDRVRV